MSENDKIFTFLQNLIVDMKDCEESDVIREATFKNLELDSLDFVEVQVAVKKNYRVDLVQDLFAAGTISTIGQLVDFVENESAAVQA